jgi:hypothetical protein
LAEAALGGSASAAADEDVPRLTRASILLNILFATTILYLWSASLTSPPPLVLRGGAPPAAAPAAAAAAGALGASVAVGGEGARALFATLQVATLRGGSLLPQAMTAASRVWIELGSNNLYTIADTFLDKPGYADVFVVSFEPSLDKYSAMVARNVRPITRIELGHYHERGLILPFAIAETAAPSSLSFYLSNVDGCASLKKFNKDYKGGLEFCTDLQEERTVPVISLAYALELMGFHEIEFIKIDIQGMDFFAVRSAGVHARLLRRVQIEVPVKAFLTDDVPHCCDTLTLLRNATLAALELDLWDVGKGEFLDSPRAAASVSAVLCLPFTLPITNFGSVNVSLALVEVASGEPIATLNASYADATFIACNTTGACDAAQAAGPPAAPTAPMVLADAAAHAAARGAQASLDAVAAAAAGDAGAQCGADASTPLYPVGVLFLSVPPTSVSGGRETEILLLVVFF